MTFSRAEPNFLTRTVETFGSVLGSNDGIAPGFEFIRLFLATSIVLWHCIYYTHPKEVAAQIWAGPFGPIINSAVPFFFALSGFLVTGSLLRLKNIKLFMAFRVLRIIPALLVEITISAVLLGALVSTLTPSQYFSNPMFFSYFTNVIGLIKFQLPGVFTNQFYDQVNGAIWTVPGEMACYLTLVGLALIGAATRRATLLIIFIVATVMTYLWTRKYGAFSTQAWIPLVFCFYAGSLLFHFQRLIPVHWSIAIAALAMSYYVMEFRYSLYILIAPTLLAYVVCYFGMKEMPHIRYLMDGDHSYGIYLYHCPIIQTVIWLTNSYTTWWQAFLITYSAVVILSMISWKFIEKPALSLRKALAFNLR